MNLRMPLNWKQQNASSYCPNHLILPYLLWKTYTFTLVLVVYHTVVAPVFSPLQVCLWSPNLHTPPQNSVDTANTGIYKDIYLLLQMVIFH